MLKFLKWFIGLFSSYANGFERKVDRFFRHVKSTDSLASIKRGLLSLLQENLIVVNVWMERKYKGYKYLNKFTRRKMYEDVKKIVAMLEKELQVDVTSIDEIRAVLKEKGLSFSSNDEDRIQYLYQIMKFLSPGKYYSYIRTASFGKLLRDPATEKLEGDCNQIVTLYIYLFSLKFPLEELQIKLLPEHVCLHFRGIDIEATNGTFQRYEDDTQILPVTEIISTNLLDLTDFREDVQEINTRDMLKSAQLAYAISSLKPLVAKNLNISYKNLAISAMRAKDFDTAIFYFEKASDGNSLNVAYHNAAIYYMNLHNFPKAANYAHKSGESELEKMVKYNEGVYYYKNDNVSKALSIFSFLGDEQMKKACYQLQYNKLVKKVASVKTLNDAKKYKSTYDEMLTLAQKIGDSEMEKSVRSTLNQI